MSSVLFSCCFSLISFSELDLSSFSLISDFLSSLGLSSNFSNASFKSFTSLSISSWVISLLSSAFSARDKTRLSSFIDFSVFPLMSALLILSTKFFSSSLLTSFFRMIFSLLSLKVFFSNAVLFKLSVCFSLFNSEVLTAVFLLVILSCLTDNSELLFSLAYVTCGPLTLTPPTTKNSEQPKSICFPFLTIRQFFCCSPCRLNNISLLLHFILIFAILLIYIILYL